MDGGADVSWTLDSGNYHAAAVARKEFMAHLRAQASSAADYDAAEMIFGELVANAVTHARSCAVARVWFTGWAQLCVHDDGGSGGPKRIAPAPVHAESGRGLYLVKTLARALHIDETETGWTVTVELPVQVSAVRRPA